MSDIRISSQLGGRRRAASLGPFLVRQLQRMVSQIAFGEIKITLPNGQLLHGKAPNPGPSAKLAIRRWRTVWRLMIGGELAFAESFIAGEWWTPDLLAFLEFGACNESSMQHAISGTAAQRLFFRLQHWRRRNTRRGSRRNIAKHYDLGNAFYAQWLDRDMNYSSALFSQPDQSIEAAQTAKISRVEELLDISGGERVLEIGCGWGAVMDRLVSRCKVTGITLSAEQLTFVHQRLSDKACWGHVDVRLQDYRDVQEQYDRIVSIEMIEAVGEQFWPIYFAKLRQCLTQGGTVVLQAITIAEDRFLKYRNQPDFIQRYIFPGGVLPTADIIRREAARAGLELVSQETFGLSYAKTLSLWRERFLTSWPAIERLGFDGSFKRMWEYYLCYCEVGFRSGAIDVGFYKLKPNPSLV